MADQFHRRGSARRCLYVAISHHGYGHIAQIAPVVNELAVRNPNLEMVVQTASGRAILEQFFNCEFDHDPEPVDINMAMHDAVTIDVQQSHDHYQHWLADHERQVVHLTKKLKTLGANLVLANIPPLPAVAAKRAGIPAVLLCSLNWAAVYEIYCGHLPGASRIIDQLQQDYACANKVIIPSPGLPMAGHPDVNVIAPVARQGKNKRPALDRILNNTAGKKLVLVSMGGIATPIAYDQWPQQTQILYLVIGQIDCNRDDIIPINALGFSYMDLLCSVDAFITKLGYGSLAEAACNAVPTLYLRRGDWPEEHYNIPWFEQHATCLEVNGHDLASGELAEPLSRLWCLARRPALAATGANEAADLLQTYF